ncbi:MAG: hypothetical protein ABI793_17600 [Flavobacterium sp.]
MKIFNTIFRMMLVSLVMISCNKDDDSTATETHENLLLKTTDDDLISTYTYDSDNKLVNYKLNGNAYNPAKDNNFAYNADGTLTKITEGTNSASVVSEYFYDSNKKIIKILGRDGIDIYTYTYNGNVITEIYKFTPTNLVRSSVYTYDGNGNITNVKYYKDITDANPSGTYSGVINYTYDNKKSATSSLPEAFLFPTSVNNIKTTQYNGGEIGTSQYEYNTDDYPTKRTDSYTRLYEYKRL